MNFDLDHILQLAQNHEGVDVEFKETTGQLDRGMETLCGMLNGDGGIVIFGVKNSGKIVGQEIGDKTTRMIGEAMRRFEPSVEIQPRYIKLPDADKYLIAFESIGNNPSAPFAYDGRPYQRFDSVTSVMPLEKLIRLHEKRKGLKYWWEKEVNPQLKLSMIDEGLVLKMIYAAVNENRLTGLALRDDTVTALCRLNLMTDDGLRNGAAILFGKDMRHEYPQCSLRMARFKGVKKVDFLDNQWVAGNIFELMDAAMTFFFKHLSLTGTTHHRIRRKEELEVPSNALREACLNAFTHRAWQFDNLQVNIAIYDDRVEIENPGRFPADINPNELERSEEENKKNTSQPQNEIIANVLYLTGTTEHWGRGLALMYDECDRTGVERPRYFNTENFVRIVFRRPDMSKWTHDGFVKDTVAPENDTVGVSNFEKRPSNKETGLSDYKKGPSRLISEELSKKAEERILKLISIIGESRFSAGDLCTLIGQKSRSSFTRNYIVPALKYGVLEASNPDSPNAPNQRYGLTTGGKSIYYLCRTDETQK